VFRAVLDYYRSSAVREYRIPEGEKLQMECNAPRSVPNATYSWSIARDVDTNPHLLRDTGRMQISSNGLQLISTILTLFSSATYCIIAS